MINCLYLTLLQKLYFHVKILFYYRLHDPNMLIQSVLPLRVDFLNRIQGGGLFPYIYGVESG